MSAFARHDDVIRAKTMLPSITKRAVYEFLLDVHGGDLPGYGAFTRYCRANGIPFGAAAAHEPHPRFETPPGRQLQFDRKKDLRMANANGEVSGLNVFSATVGYSRLTSSATRRPACSTTSRVACSRPSGSSGAFPGSASRTTYPRW